jgi:hypothetical protein
VRKKEMLCPCCGVEMSIKDGYWNDGSPRYSSLMCLRRIILYYYDEGTHLEILKEEYVEYKQKKNG